MSTTNECVSMYSSMLHTPAGLDAVLTRRQERSVSGGHGWL